MKSIHQTLLALSVSCVLAASLAGCGVQITGVALDLPDSLEKGAVITAEPEYIFDGATPDNGYTPSQPMTIAIYENPYSFDNEHWATLWVKSGGADNMRSVKLRQKPSTGQWFLNDIQCLSEIRLPKEADPWA